MEKQTRIANVIDSVNTEARYDNKAKALLANKAILAWILKCCVKEFEPFDLAIIEECIEGAPDVATKAVHRNEADKMLDGNQEIAGNNSEDSSATETTVTYDIRFKAVVPNSKEVVELIINVEAQTTNPSYPLESRVVYYMSRLISGQYGTVFTHSQYGRIEKVYSIWFCTGAPDYKKNTISGIALKNEAIYGSSTLNEEATDLMQGVIVNLGNPEDNVDSNILKLMNTLLAKSISAEEKKRVMQDDFKIKMTEELEMEVSEMCNLSQEIKMEGEMKKAKEMAKILYEKKVPIDIIAASAGVAVAVVEKWLGLVPA